MYIRCGIERKIKIDSIVTLADVFFERDHYFSGESHDFWEIIFVLSGKAGITADKDVYLIESGNAVIHRPMEFHRIWSESGTAPEIVILSFYAEKMPEPDGRVFSFAPETADELRSLCRRAAVAFTYSRNTIEVISTAPGKELEASSIACGLDCIIHSLMESRSSGMKVHRPQSVKNYMSIISVLEKNIHKRLTSAEIARLCSMSESNMKKVFAKYAGCGVIHYFNTIKIKKAAEYIGSGMSVKEAADLLGFADRNYFSAVFKRVTGVSPAAYKN